MSESGLKNASEKSMEIELTVTGRKSGHELSRPVWFAYDSVDGQQFNGIVKPIIDSDNVKKIVNRFISKYGESEVNKYYTKFDVCVEFILQ